MFGPRAAHGGSRGFVSGVRHLGDRARCGHRARCTRAALREHSAEVVDGQLVVAGEREPSRGAVRRYRTERWQGRSFGRCVPRDVNGDQIEASAYQEGVLRITLPKPEEAGEADRYRSQGRARRHRGVTDNAREPRAGGRERFASGTTAGDAKRSLSSAAAVVTRSTTTRWIPSGSSNRDRREPGGDVSNFLNRKGSRRADRHPRASWSHLQPGAEAPRVTNVTP